MVRQKDILKAILMTDFRIVGHLVDILNRQIFQAIVVVENGIIQAIEPYTETNHCGYLLPGFVDAHVHIESSLVVPSEFARMATVHGTVAAVSDPHEIANVLGLEGVHFMLANAAQTPFEIAFGAPSCVPATEFETAGAALSARDIQTLLEQDGLTYLSEVMNVPGVLAHQPEVMAKLAIAHQLHRPIDGHAPGLRGDAVRQYAEAHITTDHECSTLEEALEKLAAGMHIQIREGSAAHNFDALHPLIQSYPDRCMFCSDDKHPNDLAQGHINQLVKRAIALGYDILSVLRVACVNPVRHYGLKVGLLQVGDPADFIVVNNLREFTVWQTYCKGQRVADHGRPLLPTLPTHPMNVFQASPKHPRDFRIPVEGKRVRLIGVTDGQLITQEERVTAPVRDSEVVADPERDILKLVVVNRYQDAPVAIALVSHFGLKQGALASSVAHDSHNIIAVGTNDVDLCAAINAVIDKKGGLAAVHGSQREVLPLPIAGLMSPRDGYQVAADYARLDALAREWGSPLKAPFMALSFLALLVIPEIKLSDRGLFDSQQFQFVSLWLPD